MVADSGDSMLSIIAGFIAPLFVPLGFGSWKVATALITGFMAKESVVSTLTVLFGNKAGVAGALSPAAAGALLVFCLLYTPCVAAVPSVKRELGRKWAAGIVVFQCSIAWITALVVKLVASMFI
jgi:ferrous iron transport protein B